jgi:hypothetical protein
MKLDHLGDFRPNGVPAQRAQQAARGKLGLGGRVIGIPFLELGLLLRVFSRPPNGVGDTTASPGFGRQPGSETILHLAQPNVQRIGAEVLKHFQSGWGGGVKEVMGGNRSETGKRSIDTETMIWLDGHEPFQALPDLGFPLGIGTGYTTAEPSGEQLL